MKKIVFFLSIFLFINSCNKPQNIAIKQYDYDDVTRLCKWSDVFKQDEVEYLVYFYSKTCGHCVEIKQEMITFYLSEKVTSYFSEVNEDTVFGSKTNLIGINKIENFHIFGTPFLVEIKKWTVSNYFAGVNSILEFINYTN